MTTLKIVFATLFIVLLSGCTVPLEKARTAGIEERKELGSAAPSAAESSDYCRRLDSSRTTWGAIAKGSALVAGGSGVSTIPLDDSREGQIALASTAATAAVVGGVAYYIAEKKGETWARDCSAR